MPWQTWPNPPMQTPPWQQRWRGYNQGNMPPQPYSTYPQYSQNQVNPSNISIPQLQPPVQPLLLQKPPRPTQLPVESLANPNNRAARPAYNAEIQAYPTYLISTLLVQEVQLRSGKTLPQQ